jgi:pimeloyl-ACP methyl ester carboxylesterase
MVAVVSRIGSVLSAALVLIVLAAAASVWLVIPYVERRWTYVTVKEDPAKPWDLPTGAEKVSFTTADDVRLSGWFFTGTPPRNGITLLVLHGNFGNLPWHVDDVQFTRQRGFDVLLFNFRGFGMSEGRTKSESTMDRDATAAFRYLTVKRAIDPRSIAIVGLSLGAPVAATLAAQSPCRAVALITTFASAKRQAQIHRPWLPGIVLDFLSSPFDTVGTIGRAKCPVLILHGADDRVVPLTEAKAVYNAARSPKRLLVIPNARHGFDGARRETFLEGLISFLINPR